MLQHLRRSHFFPGTPRTRRLFAADGFTLIELLVVCLVIGILCAIAIPLFLTQESKAFDADAKEMARSAETTAETISTEHSGRYGQVTAEALHEVEPAVRIAPSPSAAYVSNVNATEEGYSVTVKGVDGDEMTITREADGTVARTCASPVLKTGCSEGETGNW
jgi:prepilin-type N-terminal cleavage/methylation domain-containing protein